MAIREQVKAELEKVEDEYLGVLYRLILSLKATSGSEEGAGSWDEFVAATYGCMADAPIERGE